MAKRNPATGADAPKAITNNPAGAKTDITKFFNEDGTLKNPQHELFAHAYCQTFNGGEAVKLAEIDKKKDGETGIHFHRNKAHQLMGRPEIQIRIREVLAARVQGFCLDENWVVLQLIRTLEQSQAGNPVLDREGNPIGEWTHDSRGALKALEMLGHNMGMFQKQEQQRNITLKMNFGDGSSAEVEVDTSVDKPRAITTINGEAERL